MQFSVLSAHIEIGGVDVPFFIVDQTIQTNGFGRRLGFFYNGMCRIGDSFSKFIEKRHMDSSLSFNVTGSFNVIGNSVSGNSTIT